ncbi:MAG: DUF1743 domain-containing protein [Euryarchaeota archaeon]|nr:DUF1743 domain-containing protein [Euryarchaeota archaeon]
MRVYIGVDDTDSRMGMCTTYIAVEIIRRLMKLRFNPVLYPRLVRLNPNIPWKTRGNGAVSLIMAKKSTEREVIGEIEGKPIYTTDEYIEHTDEDLMEIFHIVCDIVDEFYVSTDENTNPGVVVSNTKPPVDFYWKCVRDIVCLDDVTRWLENHKGVLYKGWGNRRGLIGALAAISWAPGDKTYELLTYKKREDWLKRPSYDKSSVMALDKLLKCTFDNYDYVEDCACIFPRALTPILYGVRGDNPKELRKALEVVKTDMKLHAWLIFETNQGTDDHIIEVKVKDIKPRTSVLVKGVIKEGPRIIKGGHVLFKLSDGTGDVWCAAYEPTKGFRKIILQLIPGDKVKVWGSVKEYPNTINIEKIEIIEVQPCIIKRPPKCPKCGKRMKSAGKNKGFKCKNCGTRLPEDSAILETVSRNIKPGLYEVPPVARRHLSKPIKRIRSREKGIC